MRNFKKVNLSQLFLIIFCLNILLSCMPRSYSNLVKYTPINNYTCVDRATNVFLFFEGEKTDFEYTKLGIVEVNECYDSKMVFDLMKQESYDMCGNAVINIKKISTPDIYTDRNNNIQTRNIITYSGMAVAIDNHSKFWIDNQNIVDTNFITVNRIRNEQLNSPGTRILGVLAGIIVGGMMFLAELPE